MKAIILAGGLGTRLRERVPDLPKPMADVAGRPFLEYVLDQLILGGVTDFTLSVGYKSDFIIKHFGEAYRNASISYAIENSPLGTGGAILHALKEQINAPVLVVNGDTFLDINYEEFILWCSQSASRVSIVLREVSDVTRYGSVLVSNERVIGFEEKGKKGPGLINAGVYMVMPTVFEDFGLSGKFSFESDLLQSYCSMLKPSAYVTNAYFIDIGVPSDYERAQKELPVIL